MQITRKIKLSPITTVLVKDYFTKEGFKFSENQNALWKASLKVNNFSVTITLFNNLTLLFQGEEKLVEKYYNFVNENFTFSSKVTLILGLDESGKGDCFGPLVLAGAIIRSNPERLISLGVEDSKNLTDEKIETIFKNLGNNLIYKVRVILPEEYNSLYQNYKNVNLLMSVEYNKLIKEFDEADYEKIILDRFSLSKKQLEILKNEIKKPVDIIVRAEENLSVALASIIARYYFSEWFKNQNIKLYKGCNKNAIELYKKLKSELTDAEFRKIAKTHFKFD